MIVLYVIEGFFWLVFSPKYYQSSKKLLEMRIGNIVLNNLFLINVTLCCSFKTSVYDDANYGCTVRQKRNSLFECLQLQVTVCPTKPLFKILCFCRLCSTYIAVE